jgi:uroporphyrinogen decarboxylase
MNARERYLNSLLGGSIDRFFRYEIGAWPSTIRRWKKEGLPQNVSDEEKLNEQLYILDKAKTITGEEEISFNEHFGYDPLFRLPVQSGYCDSPLFPKYQTEILKEEETTYTIRDVDGVIKKIFKENPDLSMPMFIEFPVKTPNDWEKLKHEHMQIDLVKEQLGDVSGFAERIGKEQRDFPVFMTACGGFGHPRNLMGDENLCIAYYDEPEMVHDIMKHWLAINAEILTVVSKYLAIDNYLIWEDMAYKNGPLIGPEMFRTFMLPYYKDLVAHAKSLGVKAVSVDTDGDCISLIPLFLESGVDAMIPFEVQSGMDVVKIREQFGDVFTIIGGIDKRALATGRDEIKKEVDRVCSYFKDSLRYIPSLDHTVPIDVPYENFLYYIECIRSYEKDFGEL